MGRRGAGGGPRAVTLAFLLAVSPLILGMGSLGGGQDVIQPPIDFNVTLVDRDGTRLELSRINIGGRVQLTGEMGRGSLRIPFENIAAIGFTSVERDWSTAAVQLKQGEIVTVRVRSSLTFLGQTGVGLYEIRARDIERIEFR